MKFKLILPALVLLSLQAFSQSKNNISVLYGFSTTNVNIHDVIGDYGYEQKTGVLFGIGYTRVINKFFSIETGVQYGDDKTILSTIVAGRGNIYYPGEVKVVSIPVFAKFTFFKYLYVDGGFLVDKQTNYTSNSVVNDQSGLGGEAGIGGQYFFGGLSIFVNPYIHNYAITRTDNNLYESGVKFGLGYSF
jgi:hypothetical protein